MSPGSPIESQSGRAKSAGGPLVSVGMPVFNGELFLRAAIDSMLTQSHTNLELIISDNASTDGTAAIANEFATRDSRVRYVRHPRNIGAPRNWNYVAKCARGKYMKWASANDYCDASMIAACIELLESDERIVLCYGTTRLVDEVTGAVTPFDGDFSITEERPSARLSQLLAQLRLNNAMSGLIRMDALRRTRLIRLYPSADFVLMAELAMAGMFVLLPQPLLFRRIGARSFSGHLTHSELREFLDPEGKFNTRLSRLRMNIGYLAAVLRASMSLSEKRSALRLVARSAYWDATKAIEGPRHASGVRH
jgi:glycosyltransferase involved in cell wall biosynthesis